MKHLDYKFTFRNDRYNSEFNSSPENYISLYLEPTGKSSCPWHNSLSTLVNGARSISDYYTSLKQRYFSGNISSSELSSSLQPLSATARTCPAINHILDNSFIVKSPTDIHISISSSGEFIVNTASNNLITVTGHPKDQYAGNMFQDLVNIKFELPLVINSWSETYMFLPAAYHSNNSWIIPPGAVAGRDTIDQQLNVNAFFTRDQTVFIRAGDPLCYIWFNSRPRLRYNDRLQTVDIQQKFAGSGKFFLRNWLAK